MAAFFQHLINGLAAGTIYALVALGYTMVYGVLKLINFAHGDVMMVGVYVGFAAATQVMMGPEGRLVTPGFFGVVLIFLISMMACALIGFVIERFAYRPLREKPRLTALITAIGISFALSYGFQMDLNIEKAWVLAALRIFGAVFMVYAIVRKIRRKRPISTAMLAIGPALLVLGFALALVPESAFPSWTLLPGASPRAFPPVIAKRPWLELGDVVIANYQVISFTIALVLMLGLQYLVFKTRFGRAMRAVSFDHRTAALMGIPVDRVIAGTFMLGSALAAGAGLLYAIKDTKIEPLMGLYVGLKAFVAAVIGGIGHVPGAVVGALLLGLCEEFIVGYTASSWRDAVAFGFLIVVLLVRPGGLFGKVTPEKV